MQQGSNRVLSSYGLWELAIDNLVSLDAPVLGLSVVTSTPRFRKIVLYLELTSNEGHVFAALFAWTE